MTDQVISSGVTSFGVRVSAGDTLTVDQGGESIQTHILNGGSVLVSGVTGADTISKGGIETVLSGGVASVAVVADGAVMIIEAGGSANVANQFRSWIHDAGIVSSGGGIEGHLQVESGGVVMDLLDLGDITTLRAASAHQITARTGGVVTVRHGAASDDVISAQGAEHVSGRDYRAVVSKAGELVVFSHGVATSAKVLSGGSAVLDKGASLRGGLVSGGVLSAKAGSVISRVLVMKAGAKAVIEGQVASGASIVLRGGTLELGDLAGFHAAISGMTWASQKLDLLGFGFTGSETASWAQSGTSGTLTVSDGAKVAQLDLVGNYATGGFLLADDHHGGTIVTRFAHAAAALPKDAGVSTLVHAGGRADAIAPTAVATSGRA